MLSRTQAGPGRTVKQEQDEISPNHVQRLNLISVYAIAILCECATSFAVAPHLKLQFHSSICRSFRGSDLRETGREWEPGTNQRQPFSRVASSSGNQNPTSFRGSLFRKVPSWWGVTEKQTSSMIWKGLRDSTSWVGILNEEK